MVLSFLKKVYVRLYLSAGGKNTNCLLKPDATVTRYLPSVIIKSSKAVSIHSKPSSKEFHDWSTWVTIAALLFENSFISLGFDQPLLIRPYSGLGFLQALAM